MKTEAMTARPPHEGHVGLHIQDDLEALSLSVEDLSAALALSPEATRALLDGEASLTPEVADRLGALLGPNGPYWLRLQAMYAPEYA